MAVLEAMDHPERLEPLALLRLLPRAERLPALAVLSLLSLVAESLLLLSLLLMSSNRFDGGLGIYGKGEEEACAYLYRLRSVSVQHKTPATPICFAHTRITLPVFRHVKTVLLYDTTP